MTPKPVAPPDLAGCVVSVVGWAQMMLKDEKDASEIVWLFDRRARGFLVWIEQVWGGRVPVFPVC